MAPTRRVREPLESFRALPEDEAQATDLAGVLQHHGHGLLRLEPSPFVRDPGGDGQVFPAQRDSTTVSFDGNLGM